jgi:D-xylulose 5-phosphate/D-fructose 6-phosphate phosphoketolase
MRDNMNNFRVFGRDETASNRLQAIYEATRKTWLAGYRPEDADGGELAPDGRVMEMLSEQTLGKWAEGYVLTGRHAFLASYEAFFHIIDSMVNQHAKWLEKCKTEVKWRASIPSLNPARRHGLHRFCGRPDDLAGSGDEMASLRDRSRDCGSPHRETLPRVDGDFRARVGSLAAAAHFDDSR